MQLKTAWAWEWGYNSCMQESCNHINCTCRVGGVFATEQNCKWEWKTAIWRWEPRTCKIQQTTAPLKITALCGVGDCWLNLMTAYNSLLRVQSFENLVLSRTAWFSLPTESSSSVQSLVVILCQVTYPLLSQVTSWSFPWVQQEGLHSKFTINGVGQTDQGNTSQKWKH